jgi:hypothetical protein
MTAPQEGASGRKLSAIVVSFIADNLRRTA